MVRQVADRPWSSYRAHVGQAQTLAWLDSDGLHGYLLGRPVADAQDRARARQRYAGLVAQSDRRSRLCNQALHGQIYLADEAFVERMQALAQPQRLATRETPKAQRQPIPLLGQRCWRAPAVTATAPWC